MPRLIARARVSATRNMSRKATIAAVLLAVLALRFASTAPGTTALARSSAIAVTPDGTRIVVANPDSASVSILDASTRVRVAEIEIGVAPSTVAVSQDGRRAFAACRDGVVAVADLTGRTATSFPAGIEPFGVVEHDGRLIVSDTAAARIRAFDTSTFVETGGVDVGEFPRGLAVEPGGRRLFVTHFRSGNVSVIDLTTMTVERVISTGADSNLSQSLAFATDGSRAFLPQTRSNSGNPALLFDTTVFPIVAVVDPSLLTNLPKERLSLDVVDRPGNMPVDAVATSAGRLYVAYAGSDDLSVIDLVTRRTLAHLQLGSNPRGLALSPDEQFVYASNALSGTVSVIDTATDTVTATLEATTIPLTASMLNGKRLFHGSASTRLARDRWISCATCHPDGGTDGRTWFFRDGPRNTPPLFGVAATLPMHWSGDLDELADVESTIRNVQAGTGLAEGADHCIPACDQAAPNAGRSADLDDLARFMASLRPPRAEPAPSEASMRGQALFMTQRAGCAECHPPPFYTDRRRHDVGTGAGALERKGSAFDTPSLRGLYQTAPYLHDGTAPSLRDAVTRHGNGALLTEQELEDLVAFLKTIPFAQPRRRAVGRSHRGGR